MREMIILAGAAALTFAGPALARPGNGNGRGFGHGFADRPAYGVRGPVGYGVGGCPPGLAKKRNGCMPPGQARKLYAGQRFRSGFGSLLGYRRIPYDVRRRYDLGPNDRYYYRDGDLYRVNPKTMLVRQVISARLHH